jgi:hypothetical protein
MFIYRIRQEMCKVKFWHLEDCVIFVESSGNSARVVQCVLTVRCAPVQITASRLDNWSPEVISSGPVTPVMTSC